jgi:hypothetical protein
MLPQEPEISEFRIDRSLVVHRPIFEVEYQVGGYAISVRHLDQVAMGQGFALRTSQHQKAMDQSFAVVHGNLRSGRPAGKENGARQQQAERL